jgi:DmsE family decaheme c-type cytochrome
LRLKAGVVFLFACFSVAVIGLEATTATSPDRQQQESDQYVGSETCQACHEDIYKYYAATPHRVTETSNKYKVSEKGCEACHGPGKEHADAGGDTEKIFNPKGKPPRVANEKCLSCHQRQEERHNFRQSEHGLNQVACIDCHSPHQPKRVGALVKTEAPALCYQCHGEVKQHFNRPFHHRVPEKGMNCTDCHNPHGGFNVKQTRDATGGTDLICLKCHTEKQGPFVFEHAPVRLEGCVVCHTPHGSNNAKLLKRNRVQQLCLECHANTPGIPGPEPPAFHDVRSPRFQYCTTCHAKIHGSNVDRLFLQ